MHKKICFLYTATNGLHKTKEDVCKKKLYLFARLVQINYDIGYFENNEYISEKKVSTLCKPRCMHITDDISKINNISLSKCSKKGIDPEIVISTFINDIKDVDIIVGHSVDFHLKAILGEVVRYNILVDMSKYLIIDTISFYHDYGYIKLEELAIKLKINTDNYDKLDLIIISFFKLYKKYKSSLA
jgi:DNA polymerase III epsilon subunit-like protein